MWTFAVVALALVTQVQAPAQRVAPVQLVNQVHYELDVRIDFASQQLSGVARITLENASLTATSEVPLTLYRLMSVSAVRDMSGAPLKYSQDVVQDADFGKLQLNEVRVSLPAPLAPGARTTIEVAYGGFLLGYAETGMLYIKDHIDAGFTILRDDAHAFPTIGYAARSSRLGTKTQYDYTARVTVPDTLVVANGGRLVERTAANGLATYTYRSIKPSWRMDFAIGKYAELQAGPIRIAYLQRDSVGAARVARAATAGLKLFEQWFGPVPGTPALTILEIEDGFGSQADVTTILQAAAAFRDSSGNHEIYHEVSHLWNAPDNDRPSPRWNEGLASFLEHLAMQQLEAGNVSERMNATMKWLRTRAANEKKWRETALIDYGRAGLTGLSYSVGALFFDQLYRRVGEKDFNRIIGGYTHSYAQRGGSTREFLTFAQANTKVNLQPLFTDWVLTPGWYDVIRDADSVEDVASRYMVAPID